MNNILSIPLIAVLKSSNEFFLPSTYFYIKFTYISLSWLENLQKFPLILLEFSVILALLHAKSNSCFLACNRHSKMMNSLVSSVDWLESSPIGIDYEQSLHQEVELLQQISTRWLCGQTYDQIYPYEISDNKQREQIRET